MKNGGADAWWNPLLDEGEIWIGALKTTAAILLALGIAFRLDLDSPGSAAVTVAIVSAQQSGMGLEKSFYRMIGTIVGTLATLLFLSLFAQQRDLFLLALIVWIGLCVAGSRWLRNFQAYGFVLAGYTAYIIGYPSYVNANATFDIAVDRFAAVTLGILCSGLIGAVILPRASAPGLVSTVRKSFLDFYSLIEQTVARNVDRGLLHKAQQDFAQQVVTLEEVRTASFFESPETRIRSHRLRRFNSEFMMVSTTLHVVHRLREDLARRGFEDVRTSLTPLNNTFLHALQTHSGHAPGSAAAAVAVAPQLATLAVNWKSHVALAHARLPTTADSAHHVELDGALVMLHQLVNETRDYTETFASLDAPRSPREQVKSIGLVAHADGLMALIAGVRAMLTVLVISTFWIYSGWADGFSATYLAAVGCALFVNAPIPTLAGAQLGKGFILGFIASFICLTFVLPSLDGFVLLCAGISPFLLIGALLQARPSTASIGSGYGLMFLTSLTFTNSMHYDVLDLLNGGVAQVLGIGAAILAFALILPAGHPWRAQRLRNMLAREVWLTRNGKFAGLRHRFESHVRDLMLQLGTVYGPDAATRLRDSVFGMRVLEMGTAMIILRHLAAESSLSRYVADLNRCLDEIADAFTHTDISSLQSASATLAKLCASIDTDANEITLPQLVHARAELRVLQLTLAEHIELVSGPKPANSPPPEFLAHAS